MVLCPVVITCLFTFCIFELKANYIRARNNDRNVFLLTASPTPNAPIEIYTMVYHIAPDVWKRHGINSLHQFLSTFGEVAPKEEGPRSEKEGRPSEEEDNPSQGSGNPAVSD